MSAVFVTFFKPFMHVFVTSLLEDSSSMLASMNPLETEFNLIFFQMEPFTKNGFVGLCCQKTKPPVVSNIYKHKKHTVATTENILMMLKNDYCPNSVIPRKQERTFLRDRLARF